MKLWLVILVWNTVSGTVGPLPYSEAECHDKVAELEQAFQAVPENRLGYHAICEHRDNRRDLGSSYP